MNPLFGVAQSLKNRDYPVLNKPSGLRFRFPFATNSLTDFSYQIQLQPAKLEWITGCFIDNSLNAQQFQLILADTGQIITVPGYSQASIELLGLNSDKVSVRGITTGNLDITVIFLNYVPPSANAIWSVIDPGTIIGTITVNGSVTALPTSSAPINGSGTLVAPNASVQVFAVNASRRLLQIYNPFVNAQLTNGGVIAVAFAAGIDVGDPGALEIAPGGSLTFDGFGVPSSAIHLSATDAGAVYSAYQI